MIHKPWPNKDFIVFTVEGLSGIQIQKELGTLGVCYFEYTFKLAENLTS